MDEIHHKKGKIYYSMGEVSEMFDVNPSLIRFWEQKFDILKPHKNKKGNRMFTPEDVDNLKLIYHLVKEKGMTLAGAQKRIKENKEGSHRDMEVVDRLLAIKAILLEIRQELKMDGEDLVDEAAYETSGEISEPVVVPQATTDTLSAGEDSSTQGATAQTQAGFAESRPDTAIPTKMEPAGVTTDPVTLETAILADDSPAEEVDRTELSETAPMGDTLASVPDTMTETRNAPDNDAAFELDVAPAAEPVTAPSAISDTPIDELLDMPEGINPTADPWEDPEEESSAAEDAVPSAESCEKAIPTEQTLFPAEPIKPKDEALGAAHSEENSPQPSAEEKPAKPRIYEQTLF